MSTTRVRELEIDGRPMEVLDLPGDDEHPLVLLHEGLGSIELWRGLPADLNGATRRRTVAYSRHGHGKSARPAKPRTPAFFHYEALNVLPELLAALEIKDPVLVGHSDGGSIALIYAAHRPVHRLALIAPHVFVEAAGLDAIRNTRDAYTKGNLRSRMQRYHVDVDAAFWGWCNVWLDPAFPSWSLEQEIEAVTAPVLVIQGADDPYGTLEQVDRIERRIPHTQRVIMPGGHSPHLEHRTQVIERIARFVAGQSETGTAASATE